MRPADVTDSTVDVAAAINLVLEVVEVVLDSRGGVEELVELHTQPTQTNTGLQAAADSSTARQQGSLYVQKLDRIFQPVSLAAPSRV